MATEYNSLTTIRKIEKDLNSGYFKSFSPGELYSLEEKVREAHSQVSEMSNAQLYFSQLADERQQIKDTYQAKKEKLNTPEERDELLSQHRSALATNQYLLGVAKSVQGKSFSEILYGSESPNLKLKAKRSLALLSMLEAKADNNVVISEAKSQLMSLNSGALNTDSCYSFDMAIRSIEKYGAVESNIKYRKALEDVSVNIMEGLNDIRATPTISYEDLEGSLVDLLAPEDHPYEYVQAVGEGLAAGEFAAFTLAQLRKLEAKFKQAYSLLSEEDQYAVREDGYQTAISLNVLQTKANSADTADAGIENLVEDYFATSKRNPQAWKGFAPGKYLLGRTKDDKKAYSLKVLTREYEKAAVTAAQPWEDCSAKGVSSPMNSVSFKAYGVVEPADSLEIYEVVDLSDPNLVIKDIKPCDDAPQIEAHEINYAELGLEEPQYVPPALEKIVARNSFSKKVRPAVYAAALLMGGVIAVLSYNPLKTVADAPSQEYHGMPAVEVVAPKVKVKESTVKTSEVKNVKLQTQHSEVPRSVTVQKSPPKKVVKSADDLYDEWANSHDHLVLKGDTIVGLWNNTYQGNLAFGQYLTKVRSLNPQLKNPDKIWPGQMLTVPSR